MLSLLLLVVVVGGGGGGAVSDVFALVLCGPTSVSVEATGETCTETTVIQWGQACDACQSTSTTLNPKPQTPKPPNP